MVRIAIVQILVFSWTNEAECDCAKKKLLSFTNREMQSNNWCIFWTKVVCNLVSIVNCRI